ncbi:hypothetical protein pb186bvf_020292 [Paramecium bursaria]
MDLLNFRLIALMRVNIFMANVYVAQYSKLIYLTFIS